MYVYPSLLNYVHTYTLQETPPKTDNRSDANTDLNGVSRELFPADESD